MVQKITTTTAKTLSPLTVPSRECKRSETYRPAKLHAGLDAAVHSLIGRFRRRSKSLRRLLHTAEKVQEKALTYEHYSDRRLHEELRNLKNVFRSRPLQEQNRVLQQALAAVSEAAFREVGLRPFTVQLAGALALHSGCLAEMPTGEGKTLVAALTAVLAGWSGRPCHIITVNDYLAARDANWFQALYRACGLRTAFVTSSMKAKQRRDSYEADVVYTTSKEIVADFLRDRLILGRLKQPVRRHLYNMLSGNYTQPDLVMRGLHTAIVDEADSVLIDEAVTPLIISRPEANTALQEACRLAQSQIEQLQAQADYLIDERFKEIELTAAGKVKISANAATVPGIWQNPGRQEELIRQALTAREFFRLDVEYVVRDKQVVIVDEFTGRMMPGRTWREGLHQAIEAKEGLTPSAPSETLARISFQNFFRLFHKLSGMTGTAAEATEEFWQIYHLPVVRIPTNKPCLRKMRSPHFFLSKEEKWNAIVKTILKLHLNQIPVLVGTRSVNASEELAALLTTCEVEFNLLNAVHHQQEARVVAEAGQPGKITIATNMAGRGTDIRLGQEVSGNGGLHVIATEFHEAGRIDRQLYGRCARQGAPGVVHVFASLDDELLQRFLPKRFRTVASHILQKLPNTAAQTWVQFLISKAQNRAERQAFRQRQNVLKMDTWIDDALSFVGREN